MDTPTLTSLSHLGILCIHGPDTVKFLQGQITSDIAKANSNQWLHGAHCTPKGRMVANFDMIKTDEQTVFMRLPNDALEQLQPALGKYIVFSKAQLQDHSTDYRQLGLMGTGVESWLHQHLGIQFSGEDTVVQDGQSLYLKLDEQRIECWLPQDLDIPSAMTELTSSSPDAWQLRDIELGRGWVRNSTSEAFLPQFLNLQTPAVNGVSFKKGCYTGQEIVARMHYKGKLKRHMYRLALDNAQEILPGADLYQGDASQSVGNVVNAVISDDSTQLLAVITGEVAEGAVDQLHLADMAPGKLIRHPLPYTIDDA